MQLVDEITASFSCNPCADQIDENGIEKKSANQINENGIEKKSTSLIDEHGIKKKSTSQIDENGIKKKSANERGENGLERKEQPSFETHTRVGQCQLLLFLPLALSVHLNL